MHLLGRRGQASSLSGGGEGKIHKLFSSNFPAPASSNPVTRVSDMSGGRVDLINKAGAICI